MERHVHGEDEKKQKEKEKRKSNCSVSTLIDLTRSPLCRLQLPKRVTTGRLINLLTFFVQRIKLKHNRWLKAGVSIRTCPLPRFHLLQHVNVKRDWIYCKTRQWKYYWLQNATRYVISKWSFLPCYQESIIDCKTRFDSFGRILGTGVPFSYVSNVKANSGSLRNLPFNVESCTSPIFLVHMWPVQEHIRRPEFPVPIEYWVAHDLYFSSPTW